MFINDIACSAIAAVCGGASQIFAFNGSYIVPLNVTSVTAVAIGGGGGGANGHMPGGGGGYVQCGTFSVTGGTTIPVTVGVGGSGAMYQSNNNIVGNTNGSVSSFGTMLVAIGGRTGLLNCSYVSGNPGCGTDGGSGSGCCCWGACGGTYGGSGGSGGSNGGSAAPCTTGGLGQGNATYAACLQMATLHNLTAGTGGIGGLNRYPSQSFYGPSGGGGGILVDGIGPSAGNGAFYLEA